VRIFPSRQIVLFDKNFGVYDFIVNENGICSILPTISVVIVQDLLKPPQESVSFRGIAPLAFVSLMPF
jgi:hypothetical protein